MVVPTVLATTARRNCVRWSDRDKEFVATSIVAIEASRLPTPLRLLSWAMPPRSIWREARRIPGDARAPDVQTLPSRTGWFGLARRNLAWPATIFPPLG